MSFGSSDMSGGKLGQAFFLLLLSSITQGFQVVDLFHYKVMEAVVGQNITLPCIIKNQTNLAVLQVEWSKDGAKLVLYSKNHGTIPFRPNISIQNEDAANISFVSKLQLFRVQKQDSGVYICDLTTFPQGSIRRSTQLKIKDADKIICNANKTVEVQTGQNVTIRCNSSSRAQYRWFKDRKLVSEKDFLELQRVTYAQAGYYNLTVNTGNQTLQTEFIVTVVSATTNLQPGLLTVSHQSSVTEQDLIQSAKSSLTTSPTSGIPATHTSVTRTTGLGTNGTSDNPDNVAIKDGDHANATSFTHYTHTNVTSSPVAYSSNDNPKTSSNHSLYSDRSITLDYGSSVFRSTEDVASEEMGIESMPYSTPSLTIRTTTAVELAKDADHGQYHLIWVLLILLVVVVFITVTGVLCRRKVMKNRMDLPPPFKPPPPPIKYSAF